MGQYVEYHRWRNDKGVEVSEGYLMVGDKKFDVISGGGGKGPLPAGEYKLYRARTLKPEQASYNSYFLDGYAYFAPLMPQFTTDRTYLGIHPDGNVPGSLGCIGIKDRVAEAFDILKGIPDEGIKFEVITMKGV